MVRNFRSDPVSPESIERILEAGLQAPSAGFAQGFEILLLNDESNREMFWNALRSNPQDTGVRRAPAIFIPFASKEAYLDRYAEPDKGWTDRDESRWPVPYWYIDTGFAALLMLLTAVDEGLDALFFGIPREDWPALRRTFGVPDEFDPIGAIALGHRAPDPPSPRLRSHRRPKHAAVHRGKW
jgi:nitroreductase